MFEQITGTYGSNETETEIYTYQDDDGLNWYVCHDSKNINATYEEIKEGVNIELLSDVDCITSIDSIWSLSHFKDVIQD